MAEHQPGFWLLVRPQADALATFPASEAGCPCFSVPLRHNRVPRRSRVCFSRRAGYERPVTLDLFAPHSAIATRWPAAARINSFCSSFAALKAPLFPHQSAFGAGYLSLVQSCELSSLHNAETLLCGSTTSRQVEIRTYFRISAESGKQYNISILRNKHQCVTCTL